MLFRSAVVANPSVAASASDSMMAAFDDAVAAIERAGVEVVLLEVPHYDELANGTFLALQAEAFAWHRRQLQQRWLDYGRPTRLTIAQGALISGGDLIQVEWVRDIARRAVIAAMDELDVDLLLSPTTGYPATPFTGADPRAVAMSALDRKSTRLNSSHSSVSRMPSSA